MATLMLALPFQTACEGKYEVDVVAGPALRAQEPDPQSELGDDERLTIEYIPGSKLIIQGTEAHPVSTVDPSLICRDIEFYNANGSLVWGTANCSTHIEDSNLTPENIKAGTTHVFGLFFKQRTDAAIFSSCNSLGDFVLNKVFLKSRPRGEGCFLFSSILFFLFSAFSTIFFFT